MSETRFRIILAVVMLLTLCLPLNPPPDTMSNGLFILWYSLGALSGHVGTPSVDLIDWLRLFLFLLGTLGVPLLILLNVCLTVRLFRGLRMLYRILLLILLPLTGYGALQLDPGWRGVGFWAHIAVISIAALIEAAFLASERLSNSTFAAARKGKERYTR